MVRVTLARGWNPGHEHHHPGDEVEVNDEVAAWLHASGALVDANQAPDQPQVTATPVPDAQGVPEVAASSVAHEDPVTSQKPVKRPPRTASVDVWRGFAESQGITVKGLTKQELIAATA